MNYVELLIDVIQLVFLIYTIKKFYCLALEPAGKIHYLIISSIYLVTNIIVVRFGFIKQPIPLVLFNLLWTFLLCYFCFAGKLYKKLMITGLFNALWMLTELTVGYVLFFMKSSDYLNVFVTSLTIMALFGITQILRYKIKKTNRYMDVPRRFRVVLLIVPFCSIIAAFGMYNIVDYIDITYAALIALFTMGLLMGINIIIFVAYDRIIEDVMIQRQNILYEQQLLMYQKHAEEREDTLLKIVNLRHDMKNHLIYIREMTDLNDKEGVIQYTDKLLMDALVRKGEISKSGNIVIDSLINYKYVKAAQLNIKFGTDITVPLHIPYDDGDILIILGNALDNAIEAAAKVNESNRFIQVSITAGKTNLSIIIKNSYNEHTTIDENAKLLTTKKDSVNHGIGMGSMNKAAEKYDGIVEYEFGEKVFLLNVLLYSA